MWFYLHPHGDVLLPNRRTSSHAISSYLLKLETTGEIVAQVTPDWAFAVGEHDLERDRVVVVVVFATAPSTHTRY
jgi:hypothetical protein